MRKVIFHYHLFKNAGSSVDELLKTNFPEHWVTREFNVPHAQNQIQVAQWLQQEQAAVAFSSHTAMLPPPKLDGVEVFPIIFVRHPIDRIASAYAFERKQGGDSFGPTVARNASLSGYIEIHLSLGHNSQCRNFHIARFAQLFKGVAGDQAALAMQALDVLPFVGLVEEFEKSVNRLVSWLSPHFPGFTPLYAANNVARDRSLPIESKLEQIRAEIGQDLYAKLTEANAGDIAMYEAVRARYA